MRVVWSLEESVIGKSTNTQSTKELFESKHLRLPAYMAAVMGERTWASPNPGSMRKGLSFFMWAIRCNGDDLPIEAINASWWSNILLDNTIVGCNRTGRLYMNLKSSVWGSYAHEVRHILDPSDADPEHRTNFFQVNADEITMIHVTHHADWFAIPSCTPPPMVLHTEYRAIANLRILFQQQSAPMPLLRFCFANKNTLTVRDLQIIAEDLELNAAGTKQELIERICAKLCG